MSEVENVISSFEPEAPVEAVTPDESPKPEPVAEEQAPEPQEEAASEGESDDDFKEWDAKRAKNRISRQDKRIAKLTWEKHQYEQKLAELQAQSPKPQQAPSNQDTEGAPKEEDYAGRFDEYIKAQAVFEARQTAKSLYEEERTKASQAAEQNQHANHIQKMAEVADKATEKFLTEVPDAITAKQEFEEMADDLPPQTIMALMSLGEQVPKAIYQLWKADKLDELASANPMQAQIMIASALATPFTKPVSKAPAPVRSAKGTVQSVSLPEDPGELLRLIRKR
jgi:hypothetical protein